ncbi:MAG: hypothetical protein KA279_01060 [Neisseria sp.]|nr:hypothetical protein [Neisseria sp.]MBP8043073.1 hypothetical protein [Neisseria sp.]
MLKSFIANRPFIGRFFMAARNQRLPFAARNTYTAAGRLKAFQTACLTHTAYY